jgi:hypothetical protein
MILGKLFVWLCTPVSMLWALAESRIWLSIALMTAASAAAWTLGSGVALIVALFVLSVLLMRADPVLEEQAAAAAALRG